LKEVLAILKNLIAGIGLIVLIIVSFLGMVVFSEKTGISMYFLIISIAMFISFLKLYKMKKEDFRKLDIVYIYAINILGFAIGSKLFSIIETQKSITLAIFVDSGYSFVGGMLGSICCVFLYCKKYNVDFFKTQSSFCVIYPLIYSISKIGCHINKCCFGMMGWYQHWIEAMIMYILFRWLDKNFDKLKTKSVIGIFLVLFGILRLLIGFTRAELLRRYILTPLCCIAFIIIGSIILRKIMLEDEVGNK
jgi:prolipoprotein diacylglyceryltransferase